MRDNVQLLAWLLIIFSVVSIATSIHLLRNELKGPVTDVNLNAVGPCEADEDWGKGRHSQNAIWRTGNDRFSLRSLDNKLCYEFALSLAGASYLVLDAGQDDYHYTLKSASSNVQVTTLEQSQQDRYVYRIDGDADAHFSLLAENPQGDTVTLQQVYATQTPGQRLSSWNRDPYSQFLERIFNIQDLKYTLGLFILVLLAFSSYFVLTSDQKYRYVLTALALSSLSLINNTIGFHYATFLPHTDFFDFILDLPIVTGNLYYAIDAVNSLYEAQIDGYVLTSYRKPLYFFIAFLFSVVMGAESGNFVSIYSAIAVMQIAFHAFCFFVLLNVCVHTLRPIQAILVGTALATLSIASIYVQVDSNIVSLWYLLLAFVLLRYKADQSNHFMLVGSLIGIHFMFAVLTFIRSEWFVLWGLASVIMHWRSFKLLVVPAFMLSLFLFAQGYLFYIGTGDYKLKISSENVGHVAFVGLWQNSFHPFYWESTDASYDEWIKAHGYTYGTEAANDFAKPEIVRFYSTFPFYTLAQASDKFLEYFGNKGWTGTQGNYSLYPERREWLEIALPVLFILALYYTIKRKDAFSFLVCLPPLVSLPIFSILQMSGGRFVTYITEAIIFASILFITEYWQSLTLRRYLERHILGFVSLIFVFFGLPWLILGAAHLYPDLMLMTPFLDPQESTLYKLR